MKRNAKTNQVCLISDNVGFAQWLTDNQKHSDKISLIITLISYETVIK